MHVTLTHSLTLTHSHSHTATATATWPQPQSHCLHLPKHGQLAGAKCKRATHNWGIQGNYPGECLLPPASCLLPPSSSVLPPTSCYSLQLHNTLATPAVTVTATVAGTFSHLHIFPAFHIATLSLASPLSANCFSKTLHDHKCNTPIIIECACV